MALTLTFGPHSIASASLIASRPAFADPYAAEPGDGRAAETDEMLMMAPPVSCPCMTAFAAWATNIARGG